jgi:hypothetical protein
MAANTLVPVLSLTAAKTPALTWNPSVSSGAAWPGANNRSPPENA